MRRDETNNISNEKIRKSENKKKGGKQRRHEQHNKWKAQEKGTKKAIHMGRQKETLGNKKRITHNRQRTRRNRETKGRGNTVKKEKRRQ